FPQVIDHEDKSETEQDLVEIYARVYPQQDTAHQSARYRTYYALQRFLERGPEVGLQYNDDTEWQPVALVNIEPFIDEHGYGGSKCSTRCITCGKRIEVEQQLQVLYPVPGMQGEQCAYEGIGTEYRQVVIQCFEPTHAAFYQLQCAVGQV